jgi:hypothetical protein
MNNTNSGIMQKKLYGVSFFIVFSIFFLLSGTAAFSDAEPCYLDCETFLWVPNPPAPASTVQLSLICGQDVTVYYRIRYACNEWWDVYIEYVVFNNGLLGGTECAGLMSVNQMIENITNQMIVQDPMNFPPTGNGNDTCVFTYRFSYSPCWSTDFPLSLLNNSASTEASSSTPKNKGKKVIVPQPDAQAQQAGTIRPCNYLQCCMQAFVVCRLNNQKVITYSRETSLPGACSPESSAECIILCE